MLKAGFRLVVVRVWPNKNSRKNILGDVARCTKSLLCGLIPVCTVPNLLSMSPLTRCSFVTGWALFLALAEGIDAMACGLNKSL